MDFGRVDKGCKVCIESSRIFLENHLTLSPCFRLKNGGSDIKENDMDKQDSSELFMAKRDMQNLYANVKYNNANWRSELELDKLVILQKVAVGDRDAILSFCLDLEQKLRSN